MRNYYIRFFIAVFTTFAALIHSTIIAAQVTEPTVFQRCWELNVEGISKFDVASDNTRQLFFSSENGYVASVNIMNGTLSWKTELGGRTTEIIYDKESLFTISRNNNKSSESKDEITIRALSSETGIVKWQKSMAAVPGSSNKHSLILDNDYLFFISSSADIIRIAKRNGDEIKESSLKEVLTTSAEVSNHKIYFGTEQKNIIIYSTVTKNVQKIPLKDIPTVLFPVEERIIIGDKLGKLIAVNPESKDTDWQVRLGAEISDITQTDRGIAVSSNDNFVYLMSPKNGAKIWKKRLAGRANITFSGDTKTLFVVNLNSDLSTFIETEKGKTVNQISIQSPNFFVNKPISIKDMIIFHTSNGLIAYNSSTNGLCKKEEKIEG